MGDLGSALLVVVVLAGAVPLVIGAYQFALIGLGRWRNHYDRCGDVLPRTAILVPAWNEALVLETSIDQLVALDYPADRLRVYVVDDASTDETPELLARKALEHPGRVFHLRREQGGQGKAHTLNHGLAVVLGESWAEAVLIMDADVVYEPDSLRKMARHLADPDVGAVTAYIKEGSRPGTSFNRFIAYEYATAQAAGRRAQNVIGALACLAGGAQLHTRANLEAIGGRIDTTSLAEDTVTTFLTQLQGRRVIFEPNAVCWAEEPSGVSALWRQRLRWARGNVQVTRRFKRVWFRRSPTHRLGGITFGLIWFSILLLPAVMVLSSAALVVLFLTDFALAQQAFRQLWILNALAFVFTTAFALLIDLPTARRAWRQAIMFPGLFSVLIIVFTLCPVLLVALEAALGRWTGFVVTDGQVRAVMIAAYLWVAGCMAGAYLAKKVDDWGWPRAARALIYLVGYGPLLCAVTFTAYVHEARHREQRWEKTEKLGSVGIRS